MTADARQRRAAGPGEPGAARPAPRFPWPVLAAFAAAGAVAAYLAMVPCRFGGAWNDASQHFYGCYTDIYPLYFRDDLDAGVLPYIDRPVEYPVLIGGLMALLARAVAWLPDPVGRGLAYFDATVLVLALCLVAAVWGTAYLAGRGGVERLGTGGFDRRAALWAGLFVAAAPAGILTAYINWDLPAVALAVLGLVGYAKGRPWLGGVLLGLAVAAKFYPLLFFGPLLCLWLRDGLRSGTWSGDPLRLLAGAAAAWAAVNVPVYLANPAGWAMFFEFSRERGADWGSMYYVLGELGLLRFGSEEALNTAGTLLFALCCAGIALLAWAAPRRPDPAPLLFLVVAAFLLTNKVWSPQFVLWLLPLAALAWPRNMSMRVPALVVFGFWQAAELGYVIGVWPFLLGVLEGVETASGAIGFETYAGLALARAIGLLAVCVLVVADILRSGDSRPHRLVA